MWCVFLGSIASEESIRITPSLRSKKGYLSLSVCVNCCDDQLGIFHVTSYIRSSLDDSMADSVSSALVKSHLDHVNSCTARRSKM